MAGLTIPSSLNISDNISDVNEKLENGSLTKGKNKVKVVVPRKPVVKSKQSTSKADTLLKKISGTKAEQPNVYSYIRVSTEMQARDGWSIDDQRRRIKDFCDSKGWNITQEFADYGISAKDYTNRPSFLAMKNLVKPGDHIIAYSLSRLARNTEQFLTLYREIKERGARIVIMDNPMVDDDSTPFGQCMVEIMAVFATLERNLTSHRTSSVMQTMSRNGTLRTKPPYGFKIDHVTKSLIPDEQEQDIINFILESKREDPEITLTEIKKKLDDKGVKIRKCKQIYLATIRDILNRYLNTESEEDH
jgi:site-specific DNA recombinase